jgi:hypothetical protein
LLPGILRVQKRQRQRDTELFRPAELIFLTGKRT